MPVRMKDIARDLGLSPMAVSKALRNHKDTEVAVNVVEHAWGDWQVIAKSHPFVKKSSTELDFPVKVPANGETRVTYTVRLTY